MARFVALLRGINVGGHNKLAMADLRACLQAAGFADVETYIQSGNVALSGPSCDGEQISRLIEGEFGLDIPVIVRTGRQLAAAISANPFPEVESEPKRLLVFFAPSKLAKAAVDAFDHERYRPDRLAAGAGEIYVAYDVGQGSSKLGNPVIDRLVGSPTTARNWTTVLKLADMAAG